MKGLNEEERKVLSTCYFFNDGELSQDMIDKVFFSLLIQVIENYTENDTTHLCIPYVGNVNLSYDKEKKDNIHFDLELSSFLVKNFLDVLNGNTSIIESSIYKDLKVLFKNKINKVD